MELFAGQGKDKTKKEYKTKKAGSARKRAFPA